MELSRSTCQCQVIFSTLQKHDVGQFIIFRFIFFALAGISCFWNVGARIHVKMHSSSIAYNELIQEMNPSVRNNLRRYNVQILNPNSLVYAMVCISFYLAMTVLGFSSSTFTGTDIWWLSVFKELVSAIMVVAYFFLKLPIKRHLSKHLFTNNQIYDVSI